MGAMVSEITSLTIVFWTVYSGADQRKYQSSRVTGLCAGNSPVTGEFPHKRPVMRNIFPFDDVIMWFFYTNECLPRAIVSLAHSHKTDSLTWLIVFKYMLFENTFLKIITYNVECCAEYAMWIWLVVTHSFPLKHTRLVLLNTQQPKPTVHLVNNNQRYLGINQNRMKKFCFYHAYSCCMNCSIIWC